ncbi:MAG: hypothetical protein RQ760_00870 [Sedimentisphaerales bacterium]|nr:hypothetical protein [Sedimentisphaerales bacterium]
MNSLRTVLSHFKAERLLLFAYSLSYISQVTILFLLAVLLSGCVTYYSGSAPAADYYYINPDKSLSTIGRVAIIELDNNSSYPAVSNDVSEKLYQALQKKQVFGLTVVRQSDSLWRSLQLDLNSQYTLDQILEIRETLKCDAVLLGTITEFRPYPHMIIGLRLKLLDLRDGQLLWGLEQVWDSADKTTQYRIKDYFRYHKRSGYAPMQEQLASVSSLEFIKFVSYEVAETF